MLFLDTPDSYYDEVPERVGEIDEDYADLRRHKHPRRPRRRRLPAADLHEDGAGPADGLLRGDRAPRRPRLRRRQLQGAVRGDRARAGPTRQPLEERRMFEQVRAAGRQARLLDHVEHRPWPLPEGRWSLGETLEDVFFAHWRVTRGCAASARPGRGRARRPRRRSVGRDRGHARDGAARPRAAAGSGNLVVPPAERPHVRPRPRRQAGSLVLQPRRVEPARRRGRAAALRAAVLPRAHVAGRDRRLARRRVRADRRARPRVQRPLPGGGEGAASAPGSLEEFLSSATACTRPTGAGRLHRGEIHHEPWSVRSAEAEIELASIAPLELNGSAALPLRRTPGPRSSGRSSPRLTRCVRFAA